MRGDVYCALMSANGTKANVDITEITFGTSSPIITFVPETARIDLQVVGIFDSNRPGIGSQYSGAVFKLDHLQQWLSLQDPKRETDIISTFLVAFKQDHFISEINEDDLKSKVKTLENKIPTKVDTQTGKIQKIYQVSSARLNFFDLAGFITSLLSTILTALGFLIMLTGVLLITNVQLMSVEDREFQTGVLRAVGENRRGIFLSMIVENLFQGIIGRHSRISWGLSLRSSSSCLPCWFIWNWRTKRPTCNLSRNSHSIRNGRRGSQHNNWDSTSNASFPSKHRRGSARNKSRFRTKIRTKPSRPRRTDDYWRSHPFTLQRNHRHIIPSVLEQRRMGHSRRMESPTDRLRCTIRRPGDYPLQIHKPRSKHST